MGCICSVCGYETFITEDFLKWRGLVNGPAPIYPVMGNGNPARDVKGFICAKCLRDANRSRLFIKTYVSGVEVTPHAVKRFRERSEIAFPDDASAKLGVIRFFGNARRIRFQTVFMVERIISNQFRECGYWLNQDLVFVTSIEKPPTIVTVEKLWGKKLGRDFFYVDEHGGEA